MADTKTYKVDGKIYEIPLDKLTSFKEGYPNAQEVSSFVSGKDTFDIPIDKVDNFLQTKPDAKPLKKKADSELSSMASEDTWEERLGSLKEPSPLESPSSIPAPTETDLSENALGDVIDKASNISPEQAEIPSLDVPVDRPFVSTTQSIVADYLSGRRITPEQYTAYIQKQIDVIDNELVDMPKYGYATSILPTAGVFVPEPLMTPEEKKLRDKRSQLKMLLTTPDRTTFILGKAYHQSIIGLANTILGKDDEESLITPQEWL
ncbi:MAG TPA: hypothetical protein VMV86_04180, partial [Methanosarcinales archaeon]|nr:hypothetical protein [Methanosarcinales archaeon]